jgi:glutamate/tyrosine decarboxylase-like PLP-dependent enzyme
VADARLSLDPETFRRLGHRVVDALADRYAGLADAPASRGATRPEMEALLAEPLPEAGSDAEQVLEVALRDVLAYGLRTDHPRFFAYVPLPGNPLAPLADALSSGHTLFAGTWIASPGAAMAELVTLGWLRELLGLAPSSEGVFVSGGSAANLTALAVALHARGDADRSRLVLYASGEAHSSIGRAARVVGVPVREVAVDGHLRMDPAALDRAMAADRAAGRRPWCVVASAGTTGTGAVDPLPVLRERCDEHGMWLHVDGAYGAPAAMCATARPLFAGLDLADSVTVDPHKWLFQTPELGCLLVRDGRLLPETFAVSPAYLRDAAAGTDEVNFSDRGINLTRQFGALKLWMSLKVYGAEAFREAIEHCLGLAEHAQELLDADGRWKVVTPAQLGIVTFRLAGGPACDERTRALVPALTADGLAVLSSTEVHGRVALRMCTDNPRTTRGDIEATIGRLSELAALAGT